MKELVKPKDLLETLVPIKVEVGSHVVSLLALHEQTFYAVTSSSSDPTTIQDGTGTRPYSASIAFCHFLRKFEVIFEGRDVIELGAGVGLCGLYLANLVQHHGRLLLTDGEPTAVAIAQRNCEYLQLNDKVHVKQLRWSVDAEEIHQQLDGTEKFDLLIGTDLLYYRTDTEALLSTIDTLLKDSGVAFLPAVVRVADLPEKMVEVANRRRLDISVIDLETFIEASYLDTIPGWYNMNFFVLTKGKNLARDVQEVLSQVGQRDFDPNSSGDENADGLFH